MKDNYFKTKTDGKVILTAKGKKYMTRIDRIIGNQIIETFLEIVLRNSNEGFTKGGKIDVR